jgi:hypothetical protein
MLSSFTNKQSYVPAIKAKFNLTPKILSVLQAFKQEVIVVFSNPDLYSQTLLFKTLLSDTVFNIIQSLFNTIT